MIPGTLSPDEGLSHWRSTDSSPVTPDQDELQAAMLQGVSRTFALTIPQLPQPLCRQISNAYLLCRIIDTIEDEPALTARQKRDFSQRFVDLVEGRGEAADFARDLAPLLSGSTIPAEHQLIQNTPPVLAITLGFAPAVREALARCVHIMGEGMVHFQEAENPRGLPRLTDLDRYCYHVAGVVGEMLTTLFCQYSPEIAANGAALMARSVSFGQGLQMTNILKDIWEDHRRGACWLPRECFEGGFDLDALAAGKTRDAFTPGLTLLLGVAHEHLRLALEYVLLIPRREAGIRKFCLWALGMALLTLRKINTHKDFKSGAEVKISRRSVRATIAATALAVRHDFLLKGLFHLAGWSLPSTPLHHAPTDAKIPHSGSADIQ